MKRTEWNWEGHGDGIGFVAVEGEEREDMRRRRVRRENEMVWVVEAMDNGVVPFVGSQLLLQ